MARPNWPALSTDPTQPDVWGAPVVAGWNDISDRADAALAANSGAFGIVALDSFSGSTDDDKLTAALSYASQQTQIPAVGLGNRSHTFNISRTPFSGMKIVGGPGGNRNPELAGGKYLSTRVVLGCGNGTSSWFVGTSSYYNIFVANIGFQGNSGSGVTQFWHQPVSTAPGLYSCRFESLGFNFMKNIFGQPASPCAMTQVEFAGHWTANNLWDTQFTIAGSDNDLWSGGYVNMGPSQSSAQYGNGAFEMILSGLSNTKVGYVYCTALNGWRGIRVVGKSDGLDFVGGVNEGYKASIPNDGNALRIEGGSGNVFGGNFGQSMNNPTASEHGVIEVTDGEWNFFGPEFYRGSAAETVPMLAQSGGRVLVMGAKRRQSESWSGRPRYSVTGGSFYCPDGSMQSA